MPHICIWIACFLFVSYASLLFSFKYLVYNQTYGLGRTQSQDHQTHSQHGEKGYSQLVDIVNFCGKQQNISPSKKTHGSDRHTVKTGPLDLRTSGP